MQPEKPNYSTTNLMSHDGELPTTTAASGGISEKLKYLETLKSKSELNPKATISEVLLIYSQFNSSLLLFHQQAAMNSDSITRFTFDPTVAKDLGNKAMLLAHVAPSCPSFFIADFPIRLVYLLRHFAWFFPSILRLKLARALTLLVNTQIVDIAETLLLFMGLQTLGDEKLMKLAYRHVVRSIERTNMTESETQKLQSVMFKMLQECNGAVAKRVLVTLWELYQRKVWFDEKTANAICNAMGIKTEALSFLLENEKQIIENDDSDSDDEPTESPQAIILDKSEKRSSTNFMSCDGKLSVAEASGGRSEKLNLQTLQSKVERDPKGYILEVLLIHSQFNSSLLLFQQQAAMNFISINGIIDSDLTTVASDPTVAEDLAERAMFLTLVAPSYPTLFFLADFPIRLVYLLHSFAQFIPSMSRFKLAHALILLVNRQTVAIAETLPLLMELQTLGDKKLTRFVSQHLVVNIRRLERPVAIKTQKLQSVMFKMLQEGNEAVAKRVLVILWRLYQRKVWFDEKTANAICTASFHPALSIKTAALSFLLENGKQVVEKDHDDSDSDDELPHMKENHRDLTMYRLRKLGNTLPYNRKCLQKPLAERSNNDYYSPLNHMIDKQGFAEKLFSCLQTYNEESDQVKMMMLKFIARIVGRHKLALLDFYPFVQKYIQPHQQDVINLLAAVVEACHDEVPPYAVKSLFKQIVNQFVLARSQPEVFTAGLNAVREICIHMPLLMNEDLLQDLALYKKSYEKADPVAARSRLTVFQEVCPSLF